MTERATFVVSGIVQGVGFRPFVHSLATELDLAGWVGNTECGVTIDVQGSPAALEAFALRLHADAPPLAMIDVCRRIDAPVECRPRGFEIVPSSHGRTSAVAIPPDTAVCDRCVEEMFDPENRRFGHPFITCTDCGPRFTIVRSLPYDRPATTMAGFTMCDACLAEYSDPDDRRHHAQPIGCLDCGPRLWFSEQTHEVGGTADNHRTLIEWTVACLRDGCIVAVKGLGGFHLACDATNATAVARLRSQKQRPHKPMAVMVRDIEAARQLAHVTEHEAEALAHPSAPIVLLQARPESPLAPAVASGNPMIGVMLPYTPVHHLLFADSRSRPLVMTSGNLAGEPIVTQDDDARRKLGSIADALLGHDRAIHLGCDDSVVRIVDGRTMPIRRSRGFAPIPVTLDIDGPALLAVGGELKNTLAITKPTGDGRTRVWLSQHIGDMGSLDALETFVETADGFCSMYDIEPETTVVDAHPGYQSSRWGRAHASASVHVVQHHEAHVASVLAEHHVAPSAPAIGFAFDGTGYGADGTIWGGEVFAGPVAGLRRVAHLKPVPLPGGDAAIKHPSRVALAHLFAAKLPWEASLAPVQAQSGGELELLRRQLDRSFACVATTSMGRLFDAVASLIGLRQSVTYEAQAAIELEIAAAGGEPNRCHYRFDLEAARCPDMAIMMDPSGMLEQIIADLGVGRSIGDIARGFHVAVVSAMAELASTFAEAYSTELVVLSGGVFQNALLVELGRASLEAAGLTVLTPRLVPPNDGGLALGQAYLALAQLAQIDSSHHQEV